MKERWETSESVTIGHPDKLADQISDAILDRCLMFDKESYVAVETLITDKLLVVAGEVTSNADMSDEFVKNIAMNVIHGVGYNEKNGFNIKGCDVRVHIRHQSPDIAMGVKKSLFPSGAGDQGTVYGYACDDTKAMIPASLYLAHEITKKLWKWRVDGICSYLQPDGKSQVTIHTTPDGIHEIQSIVVSTQHSLKVDLGTIQRDIITTLIPVILGDNDQFQTTPTTKYHINPTGQFILGGPAADTGLTGRKIIVDTYGGRCVHGGGAFSGKDPSKVDRSGAYMARAIARNVVWLQLAEECRVSISYAIGVAEPVDVRVNTFGTGVMDDAALRTAIMKNVNMTPDSIIQQLNLKEPIYQRTATNGHFGRGKFPWESINLNIM